ncbi:hypothetical protein Q1695_002465 [Nippostrongylus brasiliensis]|nr:hypothetical protein Q1695_002465 [Nippostrongylus brasiliensis]
MAADPRPCSSSNSNENSKEKTSTKPGATSRQSSLDKDKWLTIDLTHVMDDLRRIFSQQYRTHVDKRLLVQMFSALEEFRAKKSPYVVFLDVIKFTETIALWETHMYDIASWMMACEDFAVLPLAEKEKLFKHSWFLFDKFERFLMLAQLFGLKAVEEGIALTTNNIAFNMDTVRFEFGSLCDYDPESVRSMFKPFGRQAHQEIVRPVLEMDLDIFEVSYILCSLIWHVEGTDLQPSTLMRAEAVLERISNELHNHYTYDLKMPNYAARLIKLMELIGTTERVLCDMQKMIELARIFDVFKIETTEKGLFIC